MKRRALFVVTAALVSVALIGAGTAQASITGVPRINPHPPAPAAPASPVFGSASASPFAPTFGASWAGISDSSVTPPDTNGAIGPNSYMEIINLQVAIYNRSGGLIQKRNLQTLTGHSQ